MGNCFIELQMIRVLMSAQPNAVCDTVEHRTPMSMIAATDVCFPYDVAVWYKAKPKERTGLARTGGPCASFLLQTDIFSPLPLEKSHGLCYTYIDLILWYTTIHKLLPKET